MTWLYDYSKYKVEPANIPDDPHWVVMVFWDHHYTVPAWHDGDSPVTEKLKAVAYYAFTDKKEWEGMITAYYLKKHNEKTNPTFLQNNEELVFYQCTGRGKISMKVEVNVITPDNMLCYRDGYDPNESNRG